MGMMSEFKEFIAKGNVMDLAVGVIIGAAFGKIVTSLVEDVITPAILTPALKAAHLEDIKQLKTDGGILYGNFLSALLGFLVVAFVIFLLVKGVNSMRKKEAEAPAAPAGPTNEEKLLMEIRDAIKNK
jgi:large conductance mechanosensitive channel